MRAAITLGLLLVLAACSEPRDSGNSTATASDARVESYGLTGQTATEPVRRIWISFYAETATWNGGETGGGNNVFQTKSGRYVVLPQGIVLKDPAGKTNIGEVLGYVPGNSNQKGRGHITETGVGFTWSSLK